MKALILSGGSGTRMLPFTKHCAKQLLPVLNKPNLIYLIDLLKAADIKDIVVVVGETYPQVQRLLGDGSRLGVNIKYQYQDMPLGLAHAVGIAEELIKGEDFIMLLGDNYFEVDLRSMIQEHYNKNNEVTLALVDVKEPERYGIAYVEGDYITKVLEKPKNPSSNLAISGLYIFNNEAIFEAVKEIQPSWRNELEITDAIQLILSKGKSIGKYLLDKNWLDIGTPQDLMRVNLYLLQKLTPYNKGIVDSGSTILGDVKIEEGARVINSILQGPIYIGRDALIKDSFIGGDTCVGERCEIIKSSIDKSLVLSDTNIYHMRELISWKIIGYNSILDLSTEMADYISNLMGRGI